MKKQTSVLAILAFGVWVLGGAACAVAETSPPLDLRLLDTIAGRSSASRIGSSLDRRVESSDAQSAGCNDCSNTEGAVFVNKQKPGEGGVEWLLYYVQRSNITQSRAGILTIAEPTEAALQGAERYYDDGRKALPPSKPREEIKLLMDAVKAQYRTDKSKVCRHHAILLQRLCQKKSIQVDYRFAWKDGKSTGHSFNIVKVTFDDETTSWVVDSYNGIAFRFESDPKAPMTGEEWRIE